MGSCAHDIPLARSCAHGEPSAIRVRIILIIGLAAAMPSPSMLPSPYTKIAMNGLAQISADNSRRA